MTKRRELSVETDLLRSKKDEEDTRKEQPYLMPGSPEYEEYVRDLKSRPQFKEETPTEVYEKELEERALEQAAQKQVEAEEDVQNTKTWRQKRIRTKDDWVGAIQEAMMREAKKTPETDDDRYAEGFRKEKTPDIYNDAKSEDDLEFEM